MIAPPLVPSPSSEALPKMSVEAFDNFAELPENSDRLFEYIGGEVVEVPSNIESSGYGSLISMYLNQFVVPNRLGLVTGEQGGFRVSGERYAPDVGFISNARRIRESKGYHPNAPDLAVEVEYPSTTKTQNEMIIKVANYLAAGTTVWRVLPEDRTVQVYAPGQPVRVLRDGDMLDGGTALPGFTLEVSAIFDFDKA